MSEYPAFEHKVVGLGPCEKTWGGEYSFPECEAELAELGDKGWEVAAAVMLPDHYVYALVKRGKVMSGKGVRNE